MCICSLCSLTWQSAIPGFRSVCSNCLLFVVEKKEISLGFSSSWLTPLHPHPYNKTISLFQHDGRTHFIFCAQSDHHYRAGQQQSDTSRVARSWWWDFSFADGLLYIFREQIHCSTITFSLDYKHSVVHSSSTMIHKARFAKFTKLKGWVHVHLHMPSIHTYVYLCKKPHIHTYVQKQQHHLLQ